MSRRETIDKLRSIINEARLVCEHPNSQPAVSHTILTRPFLKKIARARGLRMHLVGVGLSQEIRRFLKNDFDDGSGGVATKAQLELWPAKLRPFIEEINKARVFVPSRGEFVLLTPIDLSKDETKEAGQYLITQGNDCIRTGSQLISLSRRM